MSKANFRVDPRLAAILGESYRSTEQALKELVDNAWDADAENVWIDLPEPITTNPIIIRDDGSGMTDKELQSEYLVVASDRRSRKGETSARKSRKIKGRKGIGKFAGLVAADAMEIETIANRKCTRLRITKKALFSSGKDLEHIDLPIEVNDADISQHGTKITLSELNPKFSYPCPAAMKELLILEYGRQEGFTLWVNGETITHEDLAGESVNIRADIPDAGSVKLRFTILESGRKAKQPGIITRVGGKIVGKPSFLGLDQRDDLHPKILNRIVGEIEADNLEDDVTADFGAIIDNSKGYQNVREWASQHLGHKVEEVFAREINLAKARRQKEINRQLEQLPEYRREFASAALEKVMRRFFGESEDKIDTLVNLVLEAFTKDAYWAVCKKIEEARHADIVSFAEALGIFGLVDMAVIGNQARRRLSFLDNLDSLAINPKTLEKEMHQALENNLWVFGVEYSLMSSNKTTRTAVEQYSQQKYKGKNSTKRPDLLLARDVTDRHLLIEFKRPSITIGREAEAQAREYRDDLTPTFKAMDILIIGGKVDPTMQPMYSQSDVKFTSYANVISHARSQLNWLLEELKNDKKIISDVT